jgi:ribosomal protein S18 acetylase RimI-like enzyme
MSELPVISQAQLADCPAIAALAAQTFTDTFGHRYDPADLQSHLDQCCSIDYYTQSLESGDTLLMLHLGDRLIGYAKVGHVTLPVRNAARGAQEIYRVYLDKAYHGRGFGKQLMLHILSLPRIQTAAEVYLGVWEHNMRAQALYRLYHFDVVGPYQYMVGNHADTDIIMVRKKK